MGISYQIRDDLNEFREQNAAEKIADFPFLIALLNGQFSEQKMNDVADFRKVVVENELDKKAQQTLDDYVVKCYTELDKLQNKKLRLSLYGILGKIFKPLAENV